MLRSFYKSVKHNYEDLLQTLQTINNPYPATRDCVSIKVACLENDIRWYHLNGGKRKLEKELSLCEIGRGLIDRFPEN